jgi:hypothetical protein
MPTSTTPRRWRFTGPSRGSRHLSTLLLIGGLLSGKTLTGLIGPLGLNLSLLGGSSEGSEEGGSGGNGGSGSGGTGGAGGAGGSEHAGGVAVTVLSPRSTHDEPCLDGHCETRCVAPDGCLPQIPPRDGHARAARASRRRPAGDRCRARRQIARGIEGKSGDPAASPPSGGGGTT